MSDNKKYYYLKLKENFFDTDELRILESMPNGYMYSNLLLKLYLKSLKYEGKLQLNEYIPYNPQMISTVTNLNIDIVTAGLKILEQLKLIDVLQDGTIYMIQIQNFIGLSSTEADRKRNYRAKIENEKNNLLPEGQMVGQIEDKCPKEQDKNPPEIELDIELEKKKKVKPSKHAYAEFVHMTEDEYKKLVEKYQESNVLLMINKLDNYKGSKGKKYKSDYKAILSWVADEIMSKEKPKEIEQKQSAGAYKEWRGRKSVSS